ncbi:MAG: hypothetical protein AUK34_05285 [Ignavibacteria bacterium CG2_30_36_16]|nr:DUF4159 domain-containing protein [Ignavibacteria bacterium]OIP61230.1 MAG: hypothetical protein AUK34_05285 [Ignavibacteria bacterium CG2_30_36_16]PJB01313.1 MAG: hypothetical protein CO127_04455 [Ignavibacteria bacterium CG_4_9_14_3_um_filter_36_18]
MYKILLVIIAFPFFLNAQQGVSITRLKYNGGGDWYNDPSAEVNLLKFVETNTNIKVKAEYNFVNISSDELFAHPFLFMTGHGNVVFTNDEASRLQKYLENGGFLYIDDDYGFDKAIRREMKKVFPDREFVELPFNYGLYNVLFNFHSGPPKTHKHDENPPRGFGIFNEERLVVFYTYESNPSDGWADPDVHKDTPEKREEALKFGANIIVWSLTQ